MLHAMNSIAALMSLQAAWLCLAVAPAIAQEPAATHAAAPIDTADYDAHGRFRVNGKPFFPILLYDPRIDDATLAELRDFGFNTLTCKPEDAPTIRAQGFYGAVHHAKPGIDAANILLVLGTDSPALYFKKNLLAQTAEANAKPRAAVPNRPLANAIGYWEDEPAGVIAGKLPTKAVYEDLVAALDVSAPYLYPVPYQPVASVGDAVARAREATGGTKPIVPILQLFAWDAKARYPTPAELRCMTYLALVEGASGIGYYSFGHVTGHPKQTLAEVQPELWKSVKRLNHELAELARRPTTKVRPAPALGGKVKARFFGDDGATWPLVIVNPTDRPTSITLPASDTAGHYELDDGRTVGLEGEKYSWELKPLEVIVVRRFRLK